jgi:hypothetical protein
MASASYYDESEPTTAPAKKSAPAKQDDSDETEDKLALVSKGFFKNEPKPGMREKVEVVQVYEDECSIRCVYGDDKEEKDEGETAESGPASDDTDDMMT